MVINLQVYDGVGVVRESVVVNDTNTQQRRRRQSVPSRAFSSSNTQRLQRSLLSIFEPHAAEPEQEAGPSHAATAVLAVLASSAAILILIAGFMALLYKRK